jgi:hypothetical protein
LFDRDQVRNIRRRAIARDPYAIEEWEGRDMERTRRTFGMAALAAAGALAAGPSHAGVNLVENGGMETLSSGAANQWYNYGARLADWSLTPAPGNTGTQGVVFGPGAADTTGAIFSPGVYSGLWGPGNGSANGLPSTSPAGGNYFGADDPTGYNQVLSQTITGLTAGRTYQLSFYWAAAEVWVPPGDVYNGASQNQIAVSLGAQTFTTPLESIASHGFSGWLGQSYEFTATGASEALSFLFESQQPVSVPPIALLGGVSLTAVPEPSSWALLFLGFAGIGLAAHRRSKKNAASLAG